MSLAADPDDPDDPELRFDRSLTESLKDISREIWAILADSRGRKYLTKDECAAIRELYAHGRWLLNPPQPPSDPDFYIDLTGLENEPRYVPQASRVVLPGASDPVALPLGAGAGQPFEEPGS